MALWGLNNASCLAAPSERLELPSSISPSSAQDQTTQGRRDSDSEGDGDGAFTDYEARKKRSRKEQAETNILLAKSNGYERGAAAQRINTEAGHEGHDFDPHVVDMQDGILKIYLDWCWDKRGRIDDFESLEALILGQHAQLPSIEELEDFWDFYHKRSVAY
ncbi:hypothetical protein C8A05DRAFT_39221 [Staphylotrichum tortipilum]|uniref:Uncharacterized protein n=1 Tax=Staphylotrichum tortipilum TaxID=2831512 RepID=A0AAN6MB76_9PEZI|nr:hypothetical protein C8A05DRAFT_39221 [Staphylotrichum longicolle]